MKLPRALPLLLLTALGATGCKWLFHKDEPNSATNSVSDSGSMMALCPNGICKEVALEDKMIKPKNLGGNGFILHPSEATSLKNAIAAERVDHLDVGTGANGDLTFHPDTSPAHSSEDATKVMIQNDAKVPPVEMKIVPTAAATAAMHQRLATVQKP